MYDTKAFAQAVDYQKSLFENSFSLLDATHEQGQRLVDLAFENNPLLPKNSKETYTQWVDFVKQGTETYKEFVETNLDKVKDFFTESAAPTKAKTTKKSE